MAYQANGFVNPNQRGVELPPGCKDLNDLLQKSGSQKRVARPIYPLRPGTLNDVPQYVQDLYMQPQGLSLVVFISVAKTMVWVHNRYDGYTLSVLLRQQDTNVTTLMQDLFGSIGYPEEAKGKNKLVTVSMPTLWLEAAQIVQTIVRTYGVTENAELLFHCVRVRE